MTNTKTSQYLGAAGELRVMSELVMRGFNPAKTYLDHGLDMILSNGKRIQVKTARRFKNDTNNSIYYHFTVGGWYNKSNGEKLKSKSESVDFYIFWCVEDNAFYIIPPQAVLKKGPLGGTSGFQLDVYPTSKRQLGKNEKYREAWDLLKEYE